MSRPASERNQQHDAPARDDSSDPDSPTDVSKPTWAYVARKTLREFSADQCTDLAAALTYYAVLALFPTAIALLSLVGIFGQGSKTVDTLLGVVSDAGGSSVAQTLRPTLETLSQTPRAGLALILGLVGALWSASAYVGAFGRAMNRIYEIGEGRPAWKLRPVMFLVTFVLVVLVAVASLALVVSGPLTQSLGNALGLGSAAVLAWRIAKWPVLLIVAAVIVATLYYATPNVKQTKFRWLSIGALVAIIAWVLLSIAFGLYVANFSSYNKTYGALAGVIVFLLWLWITNLALLFGAELDAELERGRELQSGVAAEDTIQLPARDTRNIDKVKTKHAEDVQRGRELRNQARENDDDRDKSTTGRR
jgi:membrane protein